MSRTFRLAEKSVLIRLSHSRYLSNQKKMLSEMEDLSARRYVIPPVHDRLQKYDLYETSRRIYIVGWNSVRSKGRVLKIDKVVSADEAVELVEDQGSYTKPQVDRLLLTIQSTSRSIGGLISKGKYYGIVGIIRFLEFPYLLVIKKRKRLGYIGRHSVYGVAETELLSLEANAKTSMFDSRFGDEAKYRSIFSSVDMTKNFYFSYTYDLSNTLQENMKRYGKNADLPRFVDDAFIWNYYLKHADSYKPEVPSDWTVDLLHGFFGTRFLKRGVNESGYVANYVETEQIVQDWSIGSPDSGHFTSFVHIRGSIPLFWTQDTSIIAPKPKIELQRVDPFYVATKLHFDLMRKRYDSPITILNLVKSHEKSPRESRLREQFLEAIETLNNKLPPEERLQYLAWDIHKASKGKIDNIVDARDLPWSLELSESKDAIQTLYEIAQNILNVVGFFHSGYQLACNLREDVCKGGLPYEGDLPGREQKGVARINCIDSLDRTNVSMFCIGQCAFAYQLQALGIIDKPVLDIDSDIVNMLMDLYGLQGDSIALQYGGSQALHAVDTYRNDTSWGFDSKDLVTTIRRYYSNNFTDAERQQAINLFLGAFVPKRSSVHIWDLDTDRNLHNPSPDSPYLVNTDERERANSRKRFPPNSQNIAAPRDTAYFQEFYNPFKLSSFDKNLSMDFLAPRSVTGLFTQAQRRKNTRSNSQDESSLQHNAYKDRFRDIRSLLQWRQKPEAPAQQPRPTTSPKPIDNMERFRAEHESAYKFYGIIVKENQTDSNMYSSYATFGFKTIQESSRARSKPVRASRANASMKPVTLIEKPRTQIYTEYLTSCSYKKWARPESDSKLFYENYVSVSDPNLPPESEVDMASSSSRGQLDYEPKWLREPGLESGWI